MDPLQQLNAPTTLLKVVRLAYDIFYNNAKSKFYASDVTTVGDKLKTLMFYFLKTLHTHFGQESSENVIYQSIIEDPKGFIKQLDKIDVFSKISPEPGLENLLYSIIQLMLREFIKKDYATFYKQKLNLVQMVDAFINQTVASAAGRIDDLGEMIHSYVSKNEDWIVKRPGGYFDESVNIAQLYKFEVK